MDIKKTNLSLYYGYKMIEIEKRITSYTDKFGFKHTTLSISSLFGDDTAR